MEALGHIPGIPGLFVACIFSAALRFVLKQVAYFSPVFEFYLVNTIILTIYQAGYHG